MRGARCRIAAGTRLVQRSGGSLTWLSPEMSRYGRGWLQFPVMRTTPRLRDVGFLACYLLEDSADPTLKPRTGFAISGSFSIGRIGRIWRRASRPPTYGS